MHAHRRHVLRPVGDRYLRSRAPRLPGPLPQSDFYAPPRRVPLRRTAGGKDQRHTPHHGICIRPVAPTGFARANADARGRFLVVKLQSLQQPAFGVVHATVFGPADHLVQLVGYDVTDFFASASCESSGTSGTSGVWSCAVSGWTPSNLSVKTSPSALVYYIPLESTLLCIRSISTLHHLFFTCHISL